MLVLLFLISLSCCIQFFYLQNGEEYWFLLCAIAFALHSSNQGQASKHNQRVFCTLLLLWVIVKTLKVTQRSLPMCFVWVTKSWGLGSASEQSTKLWVPLTRVFPKLHEISSHTIVQVIKLIMTLCFLPCKNVLTMHTIHEPDRGPELLFSMLNYAQECTNRHGNFIEKKKGFCRSWHWRRACRLGYIMEELMVELIYLWCKETAEFWTAHNVASGY